MSAQTLIVKAKEFTPTKVTYDDPVLNKRGGKSVNLRLNGQPIVLSVPLMLTWGINEWVDEQTGSVKYDMALQFDPQKSASQAKFLEAMKEFQEKIADDCVKNAKKWFGKSKLSRDAVDVLMYPILKYPKDKETGDPDHSRNPTLKVKVPFWEGRYNCEIYNMDRKALYLPPKYGQGHEGNKAPDQSSDTTPRDFVPKASHVKGLIRCGGMWFAGGKCGVTWQLVQINARPPTRLVGSGTCHVPDDSDDDELLDALEQKDRDQTDDVDEYQPTFDSGGSKDGSEEDEDEEEEEEEVVEKPPTPKKKKKVVRRKKKKSDA